MDNVYDFGQLDAKQGWVNLKLPPLSSLSLGEFTDFEVTDPPPPPQPLGLPVREDGSDDFGGWASPDPEPEEENFMPIYEFLAKQRETRRKEAAEV